MRRLQQQSTVQYRVQSEQSPVVWQLHREVLQVFRLMQVRYQDCLIRQHRYRQQQIP